MHAAGARVDRAERVQQSMNGVEGINDFTSYIPVGNVIEKLKKWMAQGAEICYLTSRTTPDELNDVKNVLEKYGFPDFTNLLFRKEGQTYKDVAEELLPDILIEDDCESIGGESEMTFPHIKPELQGKITSIVVREFAGIDNLPDKIGSLINVEGASTRKEI